MTSVAEEFQKHLDKVDNKITVLESMSAECGALLTKVSIEHRCIGQDGCLARSSMLMMRRPRSSKSKMLTI